MALSTVTIMLLALMVCSLSGVEGSVVSHSTSASTSQPITLTSTERVIWPLIFSQIGNFAISVGAELGKSHTGRPSNKARETFVRRILGAARGTDVNLVVVHPRSSGMGYEAKLTVHLGSLPYTIYMARKSKTMQVTNHGDGGWINWGLTGRWWVRWGNTVKFHNHWNTATMGKPYENRGGSPPPF